MNDKQRQHLKKMQKRNEEINNLLMSSEVLSDNNLRRDYGKEAADLRGVLNLFEEYEKLEEEYQQASTMLKDADEDIRNLAAVEHAQLKEQLQQQDALIQSELIGDNSADKRNIYLEIRAGAGGDEAAIFGGDLLSMYQRYADKRGWTKEIVNLNYSEKGGYKLAVLYIKGSGVYGDMKFESGTHRVQRVPKTEAKGRLHTSTCTVAILPEVSPTDSAAIMVKKVDLRIDTYRASGAGGQHINKTDSAVRITHLPTGVTAECQEERSQHRNKEKAMAILNAKLLLAEQTKQQEEEAQLRKSLVGSGDRAEKVRTYNYPQNRVTDHRLGLTLHALDGIMLGDLDLIIDPLKTEEKILLTSGDKGSDTGGDTGL